MPGTQQVLWSCSGRYVITIPPPSLPPPSPLPSLTFFANTPQYEDPSCLGCQLFSLEAEDWTG